MNVDHWTIFLRNEIEWLKFQGILEHTYFHAKGNNIIIHLLLKVFHMLLIRLWNNKKFHADLIGIKCYHFKKSVTYKLQTEELNSVITPFVLPVVFQDSGLLWIIGKNNHILFKMAIIVSQWMDKVPWYNKIICTKLNGQIFEDYFKTGCKDSQLLHLKKHFYHLVRQSTLLTIGFYALKSIMRTESRFIKEGWVIHSKQPHNHKNLTNIKDVGGKWFIYKMNAKIPTINRRRFIKKEQIKE